MKVKGEQIMKINYYKDTDTLYIDLNDSPSEDTIECAPDVVIDVDAHGSPVGIEIEHASRKTDVSALRPRVPRIQGFPDLHWRTPAVGELLDTESQVTISYVNKLGPMASGTSRIGSPADCVSKWIKREMDDALRR